MKRFIKYAALLVAVLMVSGSAWAYNSAAHIAQAPNNKGDAMIFPWFMALDGGWGNKLTVINTSETESVVAKVVIRSFKNSEELLDFLIYLSPADVWTGKIYYNTANGGATLYSDDDSIDTDGTGNFATVDNPVDFPVYPVKCADDSTDFGYVEVIEAAVGNIQNSLKKFAPGVKKADIFAAYQSVDATSRLAATTNIGLVLPNIAANVYTASPALDVNVLAGFTEFGNATLGLNAAYAATTFRNYLTNAHIDMKAETVFGYDSDNSFGEIEAALAKNNVALPYVNNTKDFTLHFFTFPTKESATTDCKVSGVNGPYFSVANANTKSYCAVYGSTTFDLTEKYYTNPFSGDDSTYTMCSEVYLTSPITFAEGWTDYLFTKADAKSAPSTTTTTDSNAALVYSGTPVIPTYLYLGVNEGLVGGYGAWTDSSVTVANVQYPDYHYTYLFTPYLGL